MKFRIHNSKYDDYLEIEGDSMEELKILAKNETSCRGWKDLDCWSEKISD